MLDMGFAPAIKRITGWLPQKRQSLLFSATLPSSILSLAARIVRDPVRVEMKSETPAAEGIAQQVCHVAQGDKYALLRHVLDESEKGLVLVFSRTKHGAKKLAKNLTKDGYPSEDIHGNKSQSARQRSLEAFRSGKVRVLVATDVAARGLDVKGIALVVNYNIPHEPEAYVHRIGRTARAGTIGTALSFCEPAERGQLRDIQKLLRTTIPVRTDHPFAKGSPAPEHRPSEHTLSEHRQPEQRSSEHRHVDHRHGHSHAVPNRNHRHDDHRHIEPRPAMAARAADHSSAPAHQGRSDTPRAEGAHGPNRAFPPAKHGWFVRQRRGGHRTRWGG
jgi:ATP-dependent RNA helicase RhlE